MIVIFDIVMLSLLMASVVLWGLLAWQWFFLRRMERCYQSSDTFIVNTLVRFYKRQILINELLMQFERGRSLSIALCQVLPLLGLLGTVSGMIDIFAHLAQSHQNSALHQGISLALLSTFAGLAAAIPALFVIFYLDRQKNNYRLQFQKKCQIG